MRITSKGQVTIPQDIRERLGLLPYSEVEFDVVGKSVRMAFAASRFLHRCTRRSQRHGAAHA